MARTTEIVAGKYYVNYQGTIMRYVVSVDGDSIKYVQFFLPTGTAICTRDTMQRWVEREATVDEVKCGTARK